jgi:hypothetical protein
MIKPTSLFMIVIAGVILAIWYVFKDTTLAGAINNAPVTTED